MDEEIKRILTVEVGESIHNAEQLREEIDKLKTALDGMTQQQEGYDEVVRRLNIDLDRLAAMEGGLKDETLELKNTIEELVKALDSIPKNVETKVEVDVPKDIEPIAVPVEVDDIEVPETEVEPISVPVEVEDIELPETEVEPIEIPAEIEVDEEGPQTMKELKDTIGELQDKMVTLKETDAEYESTLQRLVELIKKRNEVTSVGKSNADGAAGSYNRLRQEMANLKEAWKQMADGDERDKMAKQIEGINSKLKELDASIGNHQRNVGDYQNAIVSSFNIAGNSVKGMIAPVNALGGALKTLAKNPVFIAFTLLAGLIDGIVSAFKRSESAMKSVKQLMGAFAPVVDAVRGAFDLLAKSVVGVVDGITKAVTAIGEFFGMGDRVKEEIQYASDLDDAEKKLADDTAAAQTQIAEANKNAAEQRLIVADKDKYSYEMRVNALKKAQEEEKKAFAIRKTLAEDELAILELRMQKINELSVEEQRQLRLQYEQAKATLTDIEAEVMRFDASTTKEIVEMHRKHIKEATKEKAALLGIEKELIEQELSLLPNWSDRYLELQKERAEKELQIQINGFNARIKDRNKRETAIRLAQERYNRQLEVLDDEHQKRLTEREDEHWKLVLFSMRKGSAKYYSELSKQYIEKIDALYGNRDVIEQRWQERILKAREEFEKQYGSTPVNGSKAEWEKRKKEAEANIKSLELQYEQAITDANLEIASIVDKYYEAQAAKRAAIYNQMEADAKFNVGLVGKAERDGFKSNSELTSKAVIDAYRSIAKAMNEATVEVINTDGTRERLSIIEGLYQKDTESLEEYAERRRKIELAIGESVEEFATRAYEYEAKAFEEEDALRDRYLQRRLASMKISQKRYMEFDAQSQMANEIRLKQQKEYLNTLLKSKEDLEQALESGQIEVVTKEDLERVQKRFDELQVLIDGARAKIAFLSEENMVDDNWWTRNVMPPENSFEQLQSAMEQAKLVYQSAEQEIGESDEEFLARQVENYKAYIDAKKALDQAYFNSISETVNAISDLFGSLADVYEADIKARLDAGEITEEQAEKEFETVKGFQIAQTIINTLAGSVGAFLQASSTYPPPYGQIIGAITAASVLASGLAQVQQIKNTKIGSSSTSSSSVAPTPVVQEYEPQYTRNITTESDTQQLNQTIGDIKVYVVESDITNAQKKAEVRDSESTW